jgi:nucleoside-diphosphate-sugar epimerase
MNASTATPTVLILGANGRFGAAAAQAYAHAGWRVLAQLRRAPAQPLPAGASPVVVPLADTAALAVQGAGAQAVVYAVNPVYTRWDSELLPHFRLGMDLAERLGARLLLPGNVYNFGAQMPALLHPGTPQNPSTTKGRQRVAMEAELSARAAAGRLRASIVRAGDFYGAGSGNWFDLAIVKDLLRGKLVYPGPLDVTHAWAYLPDLARAFVAVAARPDRDAPAFEDLHFAGHACTGAELLAGIEAAAEAQGLHPPGGWQRGGMPWALIRAVGTVYPMWRELARMRYLWQVPHALDGSALAQATGPLPTSPLALALQAAVADAIGYRPAPHLNPAT